MNQANLKIVIEKFGRSYSEVNGKSEIHYNCPFCLKRRGKQDNDSKLYVNVDKLKFFCFKCGAKGRLSKNNLKSLYGVYEELLSEDDDNQDNCNDDDINSFYVNDVSIPDNSEAFEYCRSRGIDRDTINFYNIKLGTGDLFGRIVIPNIMYTNIWTDMYSSRTYLNQIPKYKNPPDCKKSNSVFNLHNIPNMPDKIYIEEGAVTAICAGRDAVCTYGCKPSSEQVRAILSKNPKSLICSYDNDSAGREGQLQLLSMFESKYKGNLYYVTLPSGIDAADMGEKRYKEYVDDCKQIYISNTYKRIFDLGS